MRSYGEIGNTMYKLIKYCVRNLAYEYRLYYGESSKIVYIDDMKDLKAKISDINTRGSLDAA